MPTRVCTTCQRELPISEFYKCGKTTNGKVRYSHECKECRKQREKQRYRDLSAEFKSYRQRCIHCGNDKWYLIEFHHREPSQKEFTVSQWRKHNRSEFLKEVEKCDPLCKNCHAEFHFLHNTQDITYEEYINST